MASVPLNLPRPPLPSQEGNGVRASPTTTTTSTTTLSTASSSAQGTTLLIGFQLISRALTFIVNQLLLRYLSPELLGISTQLEVYSISVLFFARESLRVAIQRQTDTVGDSPESDGQGKENEEEKKEQERERERKKDPEDRLDGSTTAGKTQTIVNLSYLPIYLGVILAVVLAWIYLRALRTSDPSVLQTPYFLGALKLYGFAAFWELLSEPCFVVAQQKSRFKTRAAAESIATVLRCLVTCTSAIWAAKQRHDIGVLPFALGQGVYGISLLFVYYWSISSISSEGGFSLMLRPIRSSDNSTYFMSYFSWPLLTLGSSLFAQSLVKHVLTQGDTLLITYLTSQQDQGIYALANNYGGLVARLIFQPIEESSRNYFGKLLSSLDGNTPKDLVVKASKDLHGLVRSYVLFSICVLALGPTIAPLLLKIVAGPRWATSGAGPVLSLYCYYIPFLAINGVTEAFISSVASKTEVNRQSMWMLAFSVGFAGAAYLFLRVLDLGAEGLVWANMLNMVFRIAWSTAFIRSYLKRHNTYLSISAITPRLMTIAAGVGTAAVLSQMESTFSGGIRDILESGAVALAFAIVLAISEWVYLLECYGVIRGRRE